jgi:activator of HSP90 ATPase
VQKGRPSVWNQAGTWEEKDTTGWCTERLRERLLETKYTLQAASLERYSASVTKVDSLTGDASVAITNGKKRYIFDYHVKLKFEVRDADVDEVLGNGMINIPDICSTSHDELEVNFDGWKKKPASAHQEPASECQVALLSEIRASVQRWVEDFNNHY